MYFFLWNYNLYSENGYVNFVKCEVYSLNYPYVTAGTGEDLFWPSPIFYPRVPVSKYRKSLPSEAVL